MEKMFDLRLFRKANGITQLAVAEYLDVTKQMITQVETGKVALKRICRPDGTPIEPDCTSNWARHTWATLAADLDFTEEAMSWGMGHKTGHRVTEIYIHRSDAKCDEANRKVIDYIKGTVPHLTTQDGND